MTDPATITGGPSDKAIDAAARELSECLSISWRKPATTTAVLKAAYAVDEPRIRADERQRAAREIVEWLRERSDGIYDTGSYLDAAEGVARQFGAST